MKEKMIDAILKYWTIECWRDPDFNEWIEKKREKLENSSLSLIEEEFNSIEKELIIYE